MIILVLCLITIGVSADKSLVITLRSQENYKTKDIYFGYESQKNGSLFYLLCDPSLSNNLPCAIFREEHFVDRQPRLSTCNVTLRAKYPFDRVSSERRVVPINKNKSLVLWAEVGRTWDSTKERGEYVLKFTIVDFESCKITETDVTVINNMSYMDGEFLVKTTGFAFYHDSFDVSYHHETPGSNPFCRVRIDINTGKIIREREYWYLEGRGAMEIVPEDSHDPDKGHIFFDTEGGKIYKWNHHSLHALTYYDYYQEWRNYRYSMQHQFITVCKEIQSTRVKCDQINYNGTITLKTKFDLERKNIAPVPYSLQGGGFLLLTTECISNCTVGAIYQVSKVDINGQRKKLVQIEGFNCNVNEFILWHTFFEDDQGKTCVSLLCYKSERIFWNYYAFTPEDLHVQCFNLSKF